MKQTPRRSNTRRLIGHDYSDPSYAYFITLNTKIKMVENNSPVIPEQPFTSCPELSEQAIQSFLFYHKQSRLLIFAYCLMPNHFHLLVTPQRGTNLSSLLGNYQSYVTQLAWRYGVIGKLWQHSFYDHILRDNEDISKVVEYILGNPVRAQLVERWEDWPWCGVLDPP